MKTDRWLSDVEIFAKSAGHFRVQDLINLMKEAGLAVSRATVYRSINKLLSSGRIIQISNEKERYFEFVNKQIHYHFRCKKCGRIIEFFFADIENSIHESVRKLKVFLTEQKLVLEGFCTRCFGSQDGRKKAKKKRT